MASAHTAPLVHLINNHITQGCQHAHPAFVVWKHDVVQIVRIRQDNVGVSARPILGFARGISISKRDGQLLGERPNELIERVELIGSQGLRRREI